MKISINNEEIKMIIGKQTIYEACRLLTLAQIENVMQSDCTFVLLYIGDEINYLYCDPMPSEEFGKIGAEKTNGYLIPKSDFIKEISPRLIGFKPFL